MADNRRVAIVTDSTADLPLGIRERLGITMIPLNVHIAENTWRDQVDLTTEQFMEQLAINREFPSTSQPSAGLFEQVFRDLSEAHDEVVCVLISSRLSGTTQAAGIAARAVRDAIHVEVVDSRNASLGCGFQVMNAQRLADRGMPASEIATHLRAQVNRYHVIFFVEQLEHLRRGGRVGKAAEVVGSILQLKPLLRIDEGQVVPFERARTRRKATETLIDFAERLAGIERIAALYNTTPEDAEALHRQIGHLARRETLIPIAELGPVLGTHVGPGTLGLAIEVSGSE